MKRPVFYLYVDNEGIDSLYSQISTSTEVERTTITKKIKSSKVSGNISLGGFLKSIFNLEGNTEVGRNITNDIQVKEVYVSEQKLINLIEYLNQDLNYNLYTSLKDATNDFRNTENTRYICVSEEFNLPQFYYDSEETYESINSSKTILYEIGRPVGIKPFTLMDFYSSSDKYYKEEMPRVIMSSSISKMHGGQDGISLTGHVVRYFRAHKGKNVRLNVFGLLVSINDGIFYQIKPYAIWI